MIPPQGQSIKQADIDKKFLTGPSELLVANTLLQLGSVPGMVKLFGAYKAPTGKPIEDQQRWADYERMDWSIRQLPTINVFESNQESKTSDQAWLTGTIQIQVFWPPNFRRSDARRVDVAFKGAMQNFFASQYVTDMLDELYYIQRPAKVYGLNEFGKTLTWTPNAEGKLEDQLVPVTMLDVNYRIDLRAWNRALEFMGRTKADPFEVVLEALVGIGVSPTSGYAGLDQTETEQILVQDEIEVTNP